MRARAVVPAAAAAAVGRGLPTVRRALALLAFAASAVAMSACGGHEGSGGGHEPAGDETGSAANGAAVDRAFAAAMIPHHESAIEMARIARERAQSDFVRQLADDIASTQQAEIETLERIDAELDSEGVEVGDLGVPAHMRGMEHDPGELRAADAFDRAFVDMMVPHHQGAIEMGRAQVTKGEHAELKELAHAIIEAQQREIDEMSDFRRQEYGSPSSSGHSRPGGGHDQAHPTP